ncbi:hypothetical protein P3W33_12295 [Luteibacter sp. PPL552]
MIHDDVFFRRFLRRCRRRWLAGGVASWNSGAQRIKGYAPQGIVGGHYRTFYAPDDVRRRARQGREAKQGCRDAIGTRLASRECRVRLTS